MTPILGPVRDACGDLMLVAPLSKHGTPKARERQRTRVVVDDHGNAVAYQRRCSSCGVWQSLDLDHYFVQSRRHLGMGHYCRCCNVPLTRRRYRSGRERMLERQRERYRQRAVQDPERHSEVLRRTEENRRRRRAVNPEHELGLQRERARVYRARVASDPQRRSESLENTRIANKLRNLDAGKKLRGPQGTARPIHDAFNRKLSVPSAPLVTLIEGLAADDSVVTVCSEAGVSDRTFRRWVDGAPVGVVVVDALCTRLGVCWWEVYDPERWPDEHKIVAGVFEREAVAA